MNYSYYYITFPTKLNNSFSIEKVETKEINERLLFKEEDVNDTHLLSVFQTKEAAKKCLRLYLEKQKEELCNHILNIDSL